MDSFADEEVEVTSLPGVWCRPSDKGWGLGLALLHRGI